MRASISKKLRFRIFERDSFKCRYCGRCPPSVVLEVDHILAVSCGGDNSALNLATACFDCNRGKSNWKIRVPKDALSIAREKERQDQTRIYNEFLKQKTAEQNRQILALSRIWYLYVFEGRDHELVFDTSRTLTMRRFLEKIPYQNIERAFEIAHAKMPIIYGEKKEEDRTWRYFCGICWKEIKTGSPCGRGA